MVDCALETVTLESLTTPYCAYVLFVQPLPSSDTLPFAERHSRLAKSDLDYRPQNIRRSNTRVNVDTMVQSAIGRGAGH